MGKFHIFAKKCLQKISHIFPFRSLSKIANIFAIEEIRKARKNTEEKLLIMI